MIEFVEWFGTLWLIIGAMIFAFHRDSESHLRGFYAYTMGTLMYIIFAVYLQHWGMLISQSVFLMLNIYGIYDCKQDLEK